MSTTAASKKPAAKIAAPKLVKGQQPGKAEVVKYTSKEAAVRATLQRCARNGTRDV